MLHEERQRILIGLNTRGSAPVMTEFIQPGKDPAVM